jgi:hypothetical protein
MLAIVIDAPASDLGSAVDLVAPSGTGKADKLAAPGGARVSSELWAVGRAVTAAADLTTDGKRCSPVQREGEMQGTNRKGDKRWSDSDACHVQWTAVGCAAASTGRLGKKAGD